MKVRESAPESKMMSHGYDPQQHHGAVKCPVFQTSTFEFETAEAGKRLFELAYGLREPAEADEEKHIYSRLGNPTQDVLEKRLCLWDNAEECAVFGSGMAAISTVFMEFLNPGDILLHSAPVYGGTDHFVHEFLPRFGITVVGFDHTDKEEDILARIVEYGKPEQVAMIFIETPANPTNALIDISMCARIATKASQGERQALTVVDNTYMGPVWQKPLKHGADLVVYSATKYIGGHSDVIAGAVLGSSDLMRRLKTLRTLMGNGPSPWTSWLLMRSLETLKLRMDKHEQNARQIALYLRDHALVRRVYYPAFLDVASEEGRLFYKQCEGTGGMIAFEMDGGEEEAYAFLNALKLIKLAVSLGGTESLAEHPRTMTHAGLPAEHLDEIGVTEGLVRLSIGVENPADIVSDLRNAFLQVKSEKILHGEITF